MSDVFNVDVVIGDPATPVAVDVTRPLDVIDVVVVMANPNTPSQADVILGTSP